MFSKNNKMKTILILFLIALLILSIFSLVKIEQNRKSGVIQSWSKIRDRDIYINKIINYYVVLEFLSYAVIGYFAYKFFVAWAREIYNGKLFKVILYFATCIFGCASGYILYMLISFGKDYIISPGEILPINNLIYMFMFNLFIAFILFLIDKSMQKDVIKDFSKMKDSEYYKNWSQIVDKLK